MGGAPADSELRRCQYLLLWLGHAFCLGQGNWVPELLSLLSSTQRRWHRSALEIGSMITATPPSPNCNYWGEVLKVLSLESCGGVAARAVTMLPQR